MTDQDPSPRKPAPAGLQPKHYWRRRIMALAIAVLMVAGALSAGVFLQKKIGWTTSELASHAGREITHELTADEDEHETAVAIPPQDSKNLRSGSGNGVHREENPQPATKPATLRNTQRSKPFHLPPAPGKSGLVKLDSGGLKREAFVKVPRRASWRSAEGGEPLPLILAFHGMGQDSIAMGRFADLEKQGAIVVYADGYKQVWAGAPYAEASDAQDRKFVMDLINRTAATYKVDDLRIYAAGMSNGGGFAAKLACDMPKEFAAVASVSGAFYPKVWHNCAPKEPGTNTNPRFLNGPATSFLEIHGKSDDRIHYDGGDRYGQHYLSGKNLTTAYALRAGCFGAPSTMQVTTKVVRTLWPSCHNHNEIAHLAVDGMGHVWPGEGEDAKPGESGVPGRHIADGVIPAPGADTPQVVPVRTLNASSEILAFFSRHTK